MNSLWGNWKVVGGKQLYYEMREIEITSAHLPPSKTREPYPKSIWKC